VQKSLRKDKDRYTTAMCEDLEEANDKGNMRKMYQTVRSFTQKFHPQLHCIESKSGEMVTEPM